MVPNKKLGPFLYIKSLFLRKIDVLIIGLKNVEFLQDTCHCALTVIMSMQVLYIQVYLLINLPLVYVK
jgi:hypothetical protein